MNRDTTELDSALDTITAFWHERPQCQATTLSGLRCQNAATYRWRFHGCSNGIICGTHVALWRRRVMALELPAPCVRCGTVFASADDACTVVLL